MKIWMAAAGVEMAHHHARRVLLSGLEACAKYGCEQHNVVERVFESLWQALWDAEDEEGATEKDKHREKRLKLLVSRSSLVKGMRVRVRPRLALPKAPQLPTRTSKT